MFSGHTNLTQRSNNKSFRLGIVGSVASSERPDDRLVVRMSASVQYIVREGRGGYLLSHEATIPRRRRLSRAIKPQTE